MFKIGDKVKCISNKVSPDSTNIYLGIKINEIYEVIRVKEQFHTLILSHLVCPYPMENFKKIVPIDIHFKNVYNAIKTAKKLTNREISDRVKKCC